MGELPTASGRLLLIERGDNVDALTASQDAYADPKFEIIDAQTIGVLRKLKDSQGHPLLSPDTTIQGAEQILGRTVIPATSSAMPHGAAMLVDPRTIYVAIDLTGYMRILLETYAANDQTGPRCVTVRRGSDDSRRSRRRSGSRSQLVDVVVGEVDRLPCRPHPTDRNHRRVIVGTPDRPTHVSDPRRGPHVMAKAGPLALSLAIASDQHEDASPVWATPPVRQMTAALGGV